jgi:hypothetical protein
MEFAGKNHSMPLRSVFAFNNRMAGFVIGFIAIVAVTGYFFGVENGIIALFSVIWGWIGWMVRIWADLFREEKESMAEQPIPGEPEMDMSAFARTETSRFTAFLEAFWEIIAEIFRILVIGVLIIGGIALLLYGLYRLYKLFYSLSGSQDGDLTESLLPDFVEAVRMRFRRTGKIPVHPVRRVFYNKVRKYIRKKSAAVTVLPGDTPRDIAEKIKASEDIDALTAKYEEARYG